MTGEALAQIRFNCFDVGFVTTNGLREVSLFASSTNCRVLVCKSWVKESMTFALACQSLDFELRSGMTQGVLTVDYFVKHFGRDNVILKTGPYYGGPLNQLEDN